LQKIQQSLLEGKYVRKKKKKNFQHRHAKFTKSGGIVEFKALVNDFFLCDCNFMRVFLGEK
jgi:hypothetical protein